MEIYNSEEQYLNDLMKRAHLPEGFRCSVIPVSFIPEEMSLEDPVNLNISLILTDEETESFGAVFTQNRFPGAPVIIGKKRLKGHFIRGILINNKIANVCSPCGIKDAELLCEKLGKILGMSGSAFFPVSTGIIGWKLPVKKMLASLPELISKLNSKSILEVAKGIMTTDSFPKVRSATACEGRITGIAKGAGMIEPNMATMLSFIITDFAVERKFIQKVLSECVSTSFNRISVDGDQSTSDTVIIISSNKKPCPSKTEFKEALVSVCKDLAEDIVRNGEGTSHVIKVKVRGLKNENVAVGIGKAVVNSPLVKTAIFGNDPNVGRIIGAIGDFLGNNNIEINRDCITLRLGGIEIFSCCSFLINSAMEEKLSCYLKETQFDPKKKGFPSHSRTVDLEVVFGSENPTYTVIGSDLSFEYITENTCYRS